METVSVFLLSNKGIKSLNRGKPLYGGLCNVTSFFSIKSLDILKALQTPYFRALVSDFICDFS